MPTLCHLVVTLPPPPDDSESIAMDSLGSWSQTLDQILPLFLPFLLSLTRKGWFFFTGM